jgi:predicted O-methyltransferase YrrM
VPDIRPLLRTIPASVLEVARRARYQLPESWRLWRVPRAASARVAARSNLDVQAILDSTGRDLWLSVAQRIERAGLGHNCGGVNPGDRRAIAVLVTHLRPRKVLEIGTHIGSSTLTFAAALATTNARITTVDIADVNDPVTRRWEKYGAPRSPAEIVSGLAPVTFVVDDSLSYLARTEEQYDFIFLDGSHLAATVYRELPLALQRLAPGGVLLLHDYFPEGRPLWENGEVIVGPYLAIRRLLKEGWPIKLVPLGRLPWSTKLGSNTTSLALVLRCDPQNVKQDEVRAGARKRDVHVRAEHHARRSLRGV